VSKQGKTATNKDNNISKMIALDYYHISPNMACFCKLMAQNWHKIFALVRACSGFTWRVSDCEELVGVTQKVMMWMPVPIVLVFEEVVD